MEENQAFISFVSINCNTDCYLDYDDETQDEADDKDGDEREEQDAPIKHIISHLEVACKINERASDDDVQYLLDKIIPETKVQKCFVACWLERLNIVGIHAKN